jgi:xylulokinase
MMGAIGTGNVEAGVVTASLGTSGTLYAFCVEPTVDPEGEVAAFCDSTDRWLPLVCTMNVTVATEQVRKMFNWSHDELERHIARHGCGRVGWSFLPYPLLGNETPNLPRGNRRFPWPEQRHHGVELYGAGW